MLLFNLRAVYTALHNFCSFLPQISVVFFKNSYLPHCTNGTLWVSYAFVIFALACTNYLLVLPRKSKRNKKWKHQQQLNKMHAPLNHFMDLKLISKLFRSSAEAFNLFYFITSSVGWFNFLFQLFISFWFSFYCLTWPKCIFITTLLNAPWWWKAELLCPPTACNDLIILTVLETSWQVGGRCWWWSLEKNSKKKKKIDMVAWYLCIYLKFNWNFT